MSVFVHDRLTCPACRGTGLLWAAECPRGCPNNRGPGCLHRHVEQSRPCDAPYCEGGRIICAEDGNAAIGYGADGRPACAACLHGLEAGAATDRGDQSPLVSARDQVGERTAA